MFYLIDKPAGVSSFGVIRKLRKILDIRKIWHSGTLDPFATWCLIIATGKSTKLIPLLESSNKEYIATIRFDGKTDSLDTETPILPSQLSSFVWKQEDEIVDFLKSQKEQTPPKYSAIHIDGKRSYELARKGKEFVLKKRPIEVYEVEILERSEYEITLRMFVSSWCYMRSFWPTLWEFLGTDGWYLTSLRRTKILWKYVEIDINEASEIENVTPISLSRLFHTIPTYDASKELITAAIQWRELPINWLQIPLQENEIFFLENTSLSYVSLCKKMGNEVKILKNDVV
jgi:tRNA pseudouridine55 synthase